MCSDRDRDQGQKDSALAIVDFISRSGASMTPWISRHFSFLFFFRFPRIGRIELRKRLHDSAFIKNRILEISIATNWSLSQILQNKTAKNTFLKCHRI